MPARRRIPARAVKATAHPVRTRLREIARLFLKLGTVAFGGPAVHIAMMDAEVVRRLGWMSREDFLALLGATNFVFGPNSTELAIPHRSSSRACSWPARASFCRRAVIVIAIACRRFGDSAAVL